MNELRVKSEDPIFAAYIVHLFCDIKRLTDGDIYLTNKFFQMSARDHKPVGYQINFCSSTIKQQYQN